MRITEPSGKKPLILWIIWFAFLQGIFVMQFFLGGGVPSGENAEEPMASWLWIACFVPLVLTTLLRWVFIPKIKAPEKQLSALIIGLAFAEAPMLFQLFLIGDAYPQNQVAVIIVVVFCMLQHAPIYAMPGLDAVKQTELDDTP